MQQKVMSQILINALLVLFLVLLGQSHLAAAEKQFQVEQTIIFSPSDLIYDKINNYDIVRLSGLNNMNQVGAPKLPQKIIRIALPDGMTAETVRIVEQQSSELEGRFNIFPAQPPIEISQQENLEFIAADKDIYNSSRLFPQQAVTLLNQADLAGQSFVKIAIAPLQYSPAEKKLLLNSKIRLVVEGDGGYICGDYLPERLPEKMIKKYRQRLDIMLDNPADISLRVSPAPMSRTSSLPEVGPYDHVIIASDNDAIYYQPLVNWHTRKGVRDIIMPLSYIHANYDGESDKERVRNFIIDAHQNWGAMYFLLCGEQTTIPFEYREYEATAVPSDAYYADYDDDWEYEVYLGRITTEGADEAGRWVNKVIRYETNPPWLGYGNRVVLVGMDLTRASDPPYYTSTRGQVLKDSINTALIPDSIIVKTVYDTDPDNHRDELLAELNLGVNLFNHCDHSNYNVMGVGDRNHGWYISSSDIFDLVNYNKYCAIFSIGCYANRMDVNDAISEYFVFGTDSTGAISFTGNTRSGWFYVGDPMSLSSELDYYWWAGIYANDQNRLGEALAFAKSVTDVNISHRYSDWTLNLLGEPEMPVWRAGAFVGHLTATHETELEALPQAYNVHVEMTSGLNVEDAFVCLWKGDEIYQRGYTDATGDISFDIYPTTTGTIYVTASKDDYYPYLSEATVSGNVPPICSTPGDTAFFQCMAAEVVLPVGCSDSDDNLAYGPVLMKGAGQIIGSNWYYTPAGDDSVEVTIRCEDSLGYFCETTFIVLFDINDAPVCQLPADTLVSQISPPSEIVLPLAIEDANDNLLSGVIVAGPGEIIGNDWCYTPVNDEIINVTIIYSDECNENCQESFQVTYEVMTCGDPNADLIVNIFDITYLINFLYKGGDSPDPLVAGDADGSGDVNIFDVTYLISHLYKGGPAPVCP